MGENSNLIELFKILLYQSSFAFLAVVPLWIQFSLLFPRLPQGIRHVDHFGFICRESSGGGGFHFVCYVFQCANEALVRQQVYSEALLRRNFNLSNFFVLSKTAGLGCGSSGRAPA
jgi:hypothetical protein